MGCGVSNVGFRMTNQNMSYEDLEMKLPSGRLMFSQYQMLKLNQKFLNLLDSDMQTGKTKEKQTACLGMVVERLIQRLVCNVGYLDSRFSSKFLINLSPLRSYNNELKKSLKFKYLVRLDLISTPALYPELFEPPIRIVEGTDHKFLPQGYAKIRVHGEFLEQWVGFISPNGFLRRDKIQEKFLELLTTAAARPSEPFFPAQVDESRHCGSPGKIVDPITISQILRCPASQQVFFGSAECNESRFPDPRDFRIAIVEGVPEIRLHVSFLSPTAQSLTSEDVQISIILGIGVAGWPMGTDFPSRLPIDHVDVILAYKAAQFDYYLVPKGPHPSVYCEDRYSVWEIRALPTEMFLEYHYSSESVVARVFKILTHLLEIFRARGIKTINKYVLKNLLFFELEHKKRILHWAPKVISRRVISVLEQLLISLRNQSLPSYFFPEKNILLQDDAFDDDYASDRDILEHYLRQLHSDEFKMECNNREGSLVKNELENVLLKKWDNVITSMLPAKSNKTQHLNVINNSPIIVSYTRPQMEYIVLFIREVLKLKNIQRKSAVKNDTNFNENVKDETSDKEDFIYLLKIMLDQAKQKLLNIPTSSLRIKKTSSRRLLKLDQLILNYDLSIDMLLDNIRRCKTLDYNFVDDLSMVTKIIECLYEAMDSDKKVLGPVLRPYLNQIFKGAHENCWFLSEWNKKTDLSEFEAIQVFSKLVLTGGEYPLDGILNSANKGWNWATSCLQIMQEIAKENSTKIIIGEKLNMNDSGLRLIFTPSPGTTVRLNVSITNPLTMTLKKKDSKKSDGTLNVKLGIDCRSATIKSFQDILESTISSSGIEKNQNLSKSMGAAPITNVKPKNEKQPLHVQLRENNPFTLASLGTRRQGNHRGLGSIIQALISLQKLTILQEISQYLPEDERTRVLGDIKKLSKEVHRAAVENYKKKKSCSLSERRNQLIVKQKSVNAFPPPWPFFQKKLSNSFSIEMNTPETHVPGTYKSLSEFSISREKVDIQNELKSSKEQLKTKEESLRGTCKQLCKGSRPTAIGLTVSSSFPKAGFGKKGQSTYSKSVINTPFNIKVCAYECKFHASSTQFSDASK